MMMKNSTILNSLKRIVLLLAAIGLMGAAHITSAQKPVTQPTDDRVIRTRGHSTPPIFAPTIIRNDSDFTGDQLTDMVFLDSPNSKWLIHDSNGTTTRLGMGLAKSKAVAADYDGDGIVDLASVAQLDDVLLWQILQSSTGLEVDIEWGLRDDKPVVGDYDGDGKADTAVRRLSDGLWYINGSLVGAMVIDCGLASDVAVPGDYDGDGITDAAAFRSSERMLYYFASSDQTMHQLTWDGLLTESNETFVPADYDGDGKTDFAIFNARSGVWSILESLSGQYHVEIFEPVPCGKCNPTTVPPFPVVILDLAFPGDYDNDGKVDPAVWSKTDFKVRVAGSSSGMMEFPTESTAVMLPVSAFFTTR